MRWLSFLVTVLAFQATIFSADTADVPRYSLPVGRQLVYSIAGSSTGESMSHRSSGTITITVLRENPDGSRRVVVNTTTKAEYGSDRPHENSDLRQMDVLLDGRITGKPSNDLLAIFHASIPVLPPLPQASEIDKGWRIVNEPALQATNFARGQDREGEFVFTGTSVGLIDKIYLTSSVSTYHFDRAKGIITLIEGKNSQDYGFHTKGTAMTKLESDTTLPAEQCEKLAAAYDTAFTAREAYQEKLRVVHGAKPAEAGLDEAKAILDKAEAGIDVPEAKKVLADLQKSHAAHATYYRDSSSKKNDVVDKPSPDWSATTVDGKPIALADLKGKVVVMDFWYRGCGWCMYAMPQVKQLATDYKDKPVAVLGMNTDGVEKDAQLVIDAFGLNYPTVKASGIPQKYNINGFPTLVVIDQTGVVRDVHVGYSPSLRADIGKKIDELLKEPSK